jgi:type II secretory pathway component PulF
MIRVLIDMVEDIGSRLPRWEPRFFTAINDGITRSLFSWTVREAFYRHMAGQLSNNIGELPALENFRRGLIRDRKTRSASIIRDIIRRMNNGSALSEAIRRWVPPDEALTLMGGEKAGNIGAAFKYIVKGKRRIINIVRVSRRAFTHPVIYIGAVFLLLFAVGYYMVPKLAPTGQATTFHGAAAALVMLGNLASSYWTAVPLIMTISGIAWIWWALPNWTGRARRIAERHFPFNFYRDTKGIEWVATFSSNLKAGTADVRILEDQLSYASPFLRQRIQFMRKSMIDGKSLPEALVASNFDFPSPAIINEIESMAGFKDFSDMIATRVDEWAEDLEWKTEEKMKALGFTSNLIMYAIMLFVAFGFTSMSLELAHSTLF